MATRTPARDPFADAGLPDRYQRVRRVAAGGMATVWCAEDAILGRRVAIKLLADHYVDDFLAVRRFKREARTAARVSSHPNIVTIFDVGETAPGDARGRAQPFIVMEHLPCGTVADAQRVGGVTRDDALRWIREAAAALDYAHEHGVIHRDIKPANMLIDRSRSLHVGDFGIARIAHEDTITKGGQLFGTAAYLSPEQARGEPGTEASDRYALAVVAFELFTGERLFKGEHVAAQARAHVEATPPRASEVNPALPPALDHVLARGLAKAPEERWPSAEAFAHAVATAMRGPRRAPVPPPPETVVFTRHRTSARPRAIALGALLAATVIIGAVVALAASGGGGSSHVRAAANTAPVHHRVARHRAHRRPVTHTTTTTARTAPTSTTTTAAPTTPAPAPVPPPTSAAALEARGHSLLSSGNPAAAIPVLREAVSAASPGSLTYAYALFDLGHALRLAGDPAAAVPILQQRLRIPNQTAVVQSELDAALAALHPSSGRGSAHAPTPPAAHAPPDRGPHAARGKHD